MVTTIAEHPWWKEAIFYQIYPASFKDTNGDGVGDIPGIISSLDYIKGLGVDVIWVCPMYESPQVDMGYDISNYEAVHAPYGTMQDMENLIAGCHERGMKIILDLVINHTSNQHAWFKESRSSKDNPYRDYYIWRPAKIDANGNRQPPNNWRGNFGGSVWEWDELTQEYYLHLFCPEQPDLNWENPKARRAIYKSGIEFWLEKGIDGYRVDTVNMYDKTLIDQDAEIMDETSPWQRASQLYCNGPRMHEYLDEMNVILEKYNAVTVGELPCTPDMERVLRYISAKEKQLSMVFQFDVVDIGQGDMKYTTTPRNWKLPELKDAINRTQEVLNGTDAWTTVFLENHDQSRSISRFGSDETPELRNKSGKMLALMLTTLSGSLFIYEGQEIGQINAPLSWPISEYKDVDTINYYKHIDEKTGGDPKALEKAKAALQHLARDHSRLPVQWDATRNAGFTTSDNPWMKVHDDYVNINVKRESLDPDSILNYWKKVIQVRKQNADLFTHGLFEIQDREDENLFIYTKTAKSSKALVVLNFSKEAQDFDENKWRVSPKDLVLSNGSVDSTKLQAFEGRVYLMDN